MTWKVLDAGATLRTITSMKVLDGATLRTVVRAKVMDSDGVTLRTVATFVTALTASPSPSSVTGIGYSPTSPVNVTSDPASCVPSGGLPPYTYAWTIISGSATINSPTLATTTFSKSISSFSTPEYATARCTVTDSDGNTATVDVSITFVLIFDAGGA